MVGFISNLGTGEVVVIALVALVVLGPERLPELARSAGRLWSQVRAFTSEMEHQVGDLGQSAEMEAVKELSEFVARPRQKLAEYALEAEAESRRLVTGESQGGEPQGGEPQGGEPQGGGPQGGGPQGGEPHTI